MKQMEEAKNLEIKKAPEELTEQDLKKVAGGSDWDDSGDCDCLRNCRTH